MKCRDRWMCDDWCVEINFVKGGGCKLYLFIWRKPIIFIDYSKYWNNYFITTQKNLGEGLQNSLRLGLVRRRTMSWSKRKRNDTVLPEMEKRSLLVYIEKESETSQRHVLRTRRIYYRHFESKSYSSTYLSDIQRRASFTFYPNAWRMRDRHLAATTVITIVLKIDRLPRFRFLFLYDRPR